MKTIPQISSFRLVDVAKDDRSVDLRLIPFAIFLASAICVVLAMLNGNSARAAGDLAREATAERLVNICMFVCFAMIGIVALIQHKYGPKD